MNEDTRIKTTHNLEEVAAEDFDGDSGQHHEGDTSVNLGVDMWQ